MADFTRIDEATGKRILDCVKEVENINGPGVSRVPGKSISINPPKPTASREIFQDRVAIVSLSGHADAPGTYQGIRWSSPATGRAEDDGVPLAVGDFGTTNIETIRIINLCEASTSGHLYSNGSAHYFIGRYLNTAEDGVRVFTIDGYAPLPSYGVVTASAQIGSNMQWTYTMQPYIKTGAGHGGWVTFGSTISGVFNLMEYGNGATGLMGNGVTLDGGGVVAGTSLTLGAIPTGKGMHKLEGITASSAISEAWFSCPNPLTGTC
jgi:hypothetical protein